MADQSTVPVEGTTRKANPTESHGRTGTGESSNLVGLLFQELHQIRDRIDVVLNKHEGQSKVCVDARSSPTVPESPPPMIEKFTGPSGVTFAWGPDCRSVRKADKVFGLGPKQSSVIRLLLESLANGTPDVSIGHIEEHIHARTGAKAKFRLKDVFKGKEGAFRDLICEGSTKGTVRLNV